MTKIQIKHLLLTCLVVAVSSTAEAQECKEVTTVEPFDQAAYASTWYVQQQAVTQYLPESRNYCTKAEYEILDKATSPWGYTIKVKNSDADSSGKSRDSPMDLCAFTPDANVKSKLKVAPCFLPKIFSGDYWVVAYDESEGYALVSGGQPTKQGQNGLCTTGTGTNGSGLWIFTRKQERDETLVNKVRAIATEAGFDVFVLNDVDQTNCSSGSEYASGLRGVALD